MSQPSSPPKRQDAARNRSKLIAAAREVFAELGPDAPLEEVATRASVSRMTLYRNFASRQELATEIYARDVAKIEEFSTRVHGSERGIIDLFEFVLGMVLDDRSLFHIVSSPEIEWYEELVTRMTKAFKPLVKAGKQAGLVRTGTTVDDFRLAFAMAQAGMNNNAASRERQAKRRIRRLLFSALFTEEA